MKVIKTNGTNLSDVFYFIENKNKIFDTIELVNEFGLESREEYIGYIYDQIILNINKDYHIYLIVSIHSDIKNEKLRELKFEREIKKIGITNFNLLSKTGDEHKNIYCLSLYNLGNLDALKNVYNYENTIIFSKEDISSKLDIKMSDDIAYQINYNNIIDDINSKFILISDYKASDADTYFVIKYKWDKLHDMRCFFNNITSYIDNICAWPSV